MSGSDFGSEESRLSHRVRRYARVGASVGGLAAQSVSMKYVLVKIREEIKMFLEVKVLMKK